MWLAARPIAEITNHSIDPYLSDSSAETDQMRLSKTPTMP